MNNAVRILVFAVGLFWLAFAFSLQYIDSMLIDFTQIPQQELQFFRFVFYCFFIGFMLLTLYVGDKYE